MDTRLIGGLGQGGGYTLPSGDTTPLGMIELQPFKVTRVQASIHFFFFFYSSEVYSLWSRCLQGPLFLTFQTLAILRDQCHLLHAFSDTVRGK